MTKTNKAEQGKDIPAALMISGRLANPAMPRYNLPISTRVVNKMKPNINWPIAVFDSGVGGLSVLKPLLALMPQEHFLYFGDSKNAPYGTKSVQKVRELTLSRIQELVSEGVKAVVVACNTATSAAIDVLRASYPELIIIGIEPALKLAADHTQQGAIAVLATAMTLREEKFQSLCASIVPAGRLFPLR